MDKQDTEPFRFPSEYYRITNDHFKIKRQNRWFCNKLEEETRETLNLEFQEKNQCSSVVEEEFFSSHSESPVHDSDADPEYTPSDNSSESEISLSSPHFMYSPEGLSTPESTLEVNVPAHTSVVITNTENNNGEFIHQQDATGDNINPKNTETIAKNINSNTKNAVFCYYCESYVIHFPRHIERNHNTELEVQKILALPRRSKKRQELLFSLRKKGNYLTSNEVIKPVRKGAQDGKVLPCTYCLGFYSARNLWRHRKQCKENIDQNSSSRSSQADAQNFLIRHLRVDPQLKADVFPRMRADQISLTAKKDPLICAFASRYLKIHREKHFILVASRKMRELARLLIEAKKIKPSIKSLCGALKAENYDVLVSATKTAAKYDHENHSFKSPTFALNMGTTLKQCCDIALLHVLKKSETLASVQSATTESELKTLIQLIEGNWKFDVSSQASNDLSIQKWNKVSLVPLASDLKLLKDYLISEASRVLSKLQQNNSDKTAYTILLETVYCRLLLLNRRRPGELQRLSIQLYKSALLNTNPQGYEEFSEAISEAEKVLMKHFKRIVIRGKRGRGVPVLISKDVQEHLEIILNCRDNIMQTSNNYIFANSTSGHPIVGYKVLKKYATQCGAKNPDALTCTRLRKHLATLTQLFNMTENDMEQLATFMGHTLGIHRSSYRLPDDVYQTAKISKLLILMEKGEAGQFKGKGLDDIDLNLEENLMEQNGNLREEIMAQTDEGDYDEEANADINKTGNDNKINEETENGNERETNKESERALSKITKKGKKRVLVRWTDQQKKVVTTWFKDHIKHKRPPKKGECEDLISKHQSLLENKDWLKIKVFIQNIYTKK